MISSQDIPSGDTFDQPTVTEGNALVDTDSSNRVIPRIVGAAVVLGFVVIFTVGRISDPPAAFRADSTATAATPSPDAAPDSAAEPPLPAVSHGEPLTDWVDPGPMGLAEMQEKRLIVDVHEHIESLAEAPLFLKAMDQFGVEKICLMGSSKFTLTLQEPVGFTGYDENNEELLKIVEAYPGRFEAWPTLSPEDPDKLKKIQDLVGRGATGVKLYTGHGYVTKKHDYMFHPVALDDPAMLPFYAWCEENYIPIVLHVNPFKEKKGFAEEFVAVLTLYPDLKVVAPHFILSTIRSNRLRELLDTFPNLYSDISFGDYFMKERLLYISKEPAKFRKIFADYPDRFMFATDLVMIKGRKDDWAPVQFQAYIDMLTKESYTSSAIPGETLRGLELSDELLSRILFRNYHAFRQYRPVNSKPRKAIDWKRMSVEPVERKPGEAFPPSSKVEGEEHE
jgi:predicted TIM-barrel fold metal-dependent hydrolase